MHRINTVFNNLREDFYKICADHTQQIQNLEGKLRALEKKHEKAERQTGGKATDDFQDTKILGIKTLPTISLTMRPFSQVEAELIRTELQISLLNDV